MAEQEEKIIRKIVWQKQNKNKSEMNFFLNTEVMLHSNNQKYINQKDDFIAIL